MNCHILFPAMNIRIEMVWYIRTVGIFLGVIDMFSDSVFDFSLCLSYILFVAFFCILCNRSSWSCCKLSCVLLYMMHCFLGQ